LVRTKVLVLVLIVVEVVEVVVGKGVLASAAVTRARMT
jgi:hypothetical protein